MAVREECGVHACFVEAAHGTGDEAMGANAEDEVSSCRLALNRWAIDSRWSRSCQARCGSVANGLQRRQVSCQSLSKARIAVTGAERIFSTLPRARWGSRSAFASGTVHVGHP